MNRTRSAFALSLGALIATLLCATWPARAQEEKKLSPKELPAVVQAAFHKAYPDAKITGASTEVENGETVYEVESIDGKLSRDLLYSQDGTCVLIEETIPLKSIPEPVKASLKKEMGKGKVQKSEKVTKGESISYEFVIVKGKETSEVVIDLSGKIVKSTKKSAKEIEEEKEK